MRTDTRTLVVLGAILLIAAALFGMAGYLQASTDQALARAVVDACAAEKDRPLCYEKRIPALMDDGVSMERAYAITRIVQDLDPGYHYCHVLAHNISAKETQRDLSKWKDVIARAPSGVCGNGALHGAFQERYRAESFPDASVEELTREFAGVCDPREAWQPTFIERSSCMHGLGHLSMYVTEADAERSIELCEMLARDGDQDFRRTCIDGAFMQVFQPLEPEDEALVEDIVPTIPELPDFCGRFEGIARTSCVKESWPLFRDSLQTPEVFSALCGPVRGHQEEFRYCASGAVYVLLGMLDYDADKAMSVCSALDADLKPVCYSRIASRFIETDWGNTDDALAVCAQAPLEVKDACYEELTTFVEQGLRPQSEEARTLCAGMPIPWKDTCSERAKL